MEWGTADELALDNYKYLTQPIKEDECDALNLYNFCVYTPKGTEVERIWLNTEWYKKVWNWIVSYYDAYVLPEILSPLHNFDGESKRLFLTQHGKLKGNYINVIFMRTNLWGCASNKNNWYTSHMAKDLMDNMLINF